MITEPFIGGRSNDTQSLWIRLKRADGKPMGQGENHADPCRHNTHRSRTTHCTGHPRTQRGGRAGATPVTPGAGRTARSWFAAYVHPAVTGRAGSDPLTRALVIEEISGYDTEAGWTLANPLDWAYLCARLPDEGAEEIYGRGANVVIAAQFGRPMQAAPTQGGYRITGRAPFVSNCYDANWIATSAVIAGDRTRPDDQGEPELVMVYLPRENCQIIDTWHVMGMRGTGSNDIAVNDVFVPTVRTFPIVPEVTPGSHYGVRSTGSL